MSISCPDTNQLHRDSMFLDGTHDLVCWMEPRFLAALHSILISWFWSWCFLFVTQFPLTSRYLERWLHLLVMVLHGTCQLRLLLPLTQQNRWFVIVTLSFFFHYGLRCALVGRACALSCSIVLPPPFSLVLLLLMRMAMSCIGKSSLFFPL